MQRGEVLREERLNHLHQLKELGVDPYPAKVRRDQTIAEALTQMEQPVAVTGRVMAIRSHGKTTFLDIADETGTIQVYAKADELDDRYQELELLDTGDFLAIQGKVFTTKMGEITIHTENFQILAKALRPLPSSWQGLKDTEERFRKRYLDLLVNPEVRDLFKLRARVIKEIRTFMDAAGFSEVETPTLQPIYGGASARPFTTHYHAYDTDVYLKIAPELYLKRLLIGGYDKVYEISRNFRNEGADHTHNPEFLELEFYAAYWDEEKLMDFAEELILSVIERVTGKAELTIAGETIVIKKPFSRTTFLELTGGANSDDALKKATKNLIEPTFVLNSPRTLLPLAKGLDTKLARSIQLYIGGVELFKAFAELNDPEDQRVQFEDQAQRKAAGETETQPLDEDFLEALEYGMPPAGGLGLGLERFIALLAGQESLRQTMYFPFMKPKKSSTESGEEV